MRMHLVYNPLIPFCNPRRWEVWVDSGPVFIGSKADCSTYVAAVGGVL
jgi:hypothetical protein